MIVQPLLLQKYLFRAFYLFAFMLFIGIFVYAFKVEMGMQSVQDEAPFSDTLRAEGKDTLPENRSVTPDQPHRTPRELARWVSQAVSEVMTFDARNYDRQLTAAKDYFSDAGYAEFTTYLRQANLKSTLVQGDLRAGIIVDQEPLLLNSGAVGGIFRWLYEVPVTISYTKRGLRELTPDDTPVMTRQLTIRLQLGRHDEADNEDGVQIESWTVSARR